MKVAERRCLNPTTGACQANLRVQTTSINWMNITLQLINAIQHHNTLIPGLFLAFQCYILKSGSMLDIENLGAGRLGDKASIATHHHFFFTYYYDCSPHYKLKYWYHVCGRPWQKLMIILCIYYVCNTILHFNNNNLINQLRIKILLR